LAETRSRKTVDGITAYTAAVGKGRQGLQINSEIALIGG
jgi:hypothetical protein